MTAPGPLAAMARRWKARAEALRTARHAHDRDSWDDGENYGRWQERHACLVELLDLIATEREDA